MEVCGSDDCAVITRGRGAATPSEITSGRDTGLVTRQTHQITRGHRAEVLGWAEGGDPWAEGQGPVGGGAGTSGRRGGASGRRGGDQWVEGRDQRAEEIGHTQCWVQIIDTIGFS